MNNATMRRLGDLEVSAQGLGCMGMSQHYGAPDEQEAVATIRRALDLGISLLDTANIYADGANESLIGRAIANRRDEAVVATKFGVIRQPDGGQGVRGDRHYVFQCCDESLVRLGVDHIDLFYAHRVDPTVDIAETVGAMSELVSAGKVRHIGLSEVSSRTIRAAHAVHPLAAVQSEWSLWTRDVEGEVLPTCRELGIGVVAYSPLGRGFLTGAITSTGQLADGDLRRKLPRFAEGNLASNLKIVEALNHIATERGLAAGQVALAWVQGRGDDVVPIPGTKRRTYLEQNIAALDVELTDVELDIIDSAVERNVAGDRYPQTLSRNLGR